MYSILPNQSLRKAEEYKAVGLSSCMTVIWCNAMVSLSLSDAIYHTVDATGQGLQWEEHMRRNNNVAKVRTQQAYHGSQTSEKQKT